MSDAILAGLKTYFGFDGFLDGQEPVVQGMMNGEDVLVVMPTGAGKSLCYQLPALLSEGYSIVVSPLISLMKDQVDALTAKGIAAAYMNSSQGPSERREVAEHVINGSYKLLYVAPERLRARDFRNLVAARKPSMLIIDEAHCISQWGHDFRPDYTRIGEFVEEQQIAQVCGFTATATPQVRDDIVAQLNRTKMTIYATGFKRPNLHFSVAQCQGKSSKLRVLQQVLADQKPTIIYASTRKNTEEVAEHFGCIAYHAGLGDEARSAAQDAFINDPCPVLVATNAFGMGIDRSDVRRVIHYNMPGSLEAFYQEAGRAGRDGEDADCLLLYNAQDSFIQEFLIDMNNPPEFLVGETYQVLCDLVRTRGTDHLELSQSELANMVPSAKSDTQISGVLRILEDHGYVNRGRRTDNRGVLRFDRPTEALLKAHPNPKGTQRAVFAHAVVEAYGDDLTDGVEVTYFDLQKLTRLNPDQLKRVLKALQDDGMVWTPPFAGRGVHVLKTDEKKPDIDFSPYQAKIDLETGRLQQMKNYVYERQCRQRYLVRYFGQDTGDWVCEVCDNCGSTGAVGARPKSNAASDLDEERCILEAGLAIKGRFGRQTIAQILTGSRSKQVVGNGFTRLPIYGILTLHTQSSVLPLVDSLMNRGLLEKAGSPRYPTIMLSEEGMERLEELRELKALADAEPDDALPPPKRPSPPLTPGGAPKPLMPTSRSGSATAQTRSPSAAAQTRSPSATTRAPIEEPVRDPEPDDDRWDDGRPLAEPPDYLDDDDIDMDYNFEAEQEREPAPAPRSRSTPEPVADAPTPPAAVAPTPAKPAAPATPAPRLSPARTESLYRNLRELRNRIAGERRQIPYTILDDKHLRLLAEQAPETIDAARALINASPDRADLSRLVIAVQSWLRAQD